ncbi:hypothetical protein N0V93_008144 [Gnomoniopsis smithogilvyi]|uniref:Uncharacterized protein n=1 Tax=Gnomoniopsis smithogilvyi TaxID=1191159 RepID=A0A9W8YL56_9PEZI|nr:hypothetical protein N0V93_008144 [Gnomoniopsis smithogilvyi]
MAQGALLASVAAASMYSDLREEEEKNMSMAYSDHPGTSNSTLFQRISRMEQVANYYIDKVKPSRASSSFSDHSAYLKAAQKAASIVKDLELVRDIRLRREQAGFWEKSDMAPSYKA